MWATRRLLQQRQPMIKFLGKRSIPKDVDHTPHAHPESPTHSLPESFAQYRNRAIQHGPLGGQTQQQAQRGTIERPQTSSPNQASSTSAPAYRPYGAIGGHSGRQLGSVEPKSGEFWDRDELPARFRRRPWTEAEMDAVDSGGASLWQ